MENNKNVFVYIRGSKTRGAEVIKTLLDLGGINRYDLEGNDYERVYFINQDGFIDCGCINYKLEHSWLETHYTEVTLPKSKHEFKPKDWVLVRDSGDEKWDLDIFGYYAEDEEMPYRCVGDWHDECIPYEGNEYLLGTTNNPE